MKIDGLYVGGWYQRTTLQLSEIYDYLKSGDSLFVSKRKYKINDKDIK